MAINVNTYTKHDWIDNSSPDLEAEILNEIETGIGDNNDAIKAIAAAVVSQIVNDPDKIASMAALYAVNQTLGNLSTTVTNINSNLSVIGNVYSSNPPSYVPCETGTHTEITSLILPAGVYEISACFSWSTMTRGGSRTIEIRKGDFYNSPFVAGYATTDLVNDASALYQSTSGIISITESTKIKLWANQKSGSNLSVDSSATLIAVRLK